MVLKDSLTKSDTLQKRTKPAPIPPQTPGYISTSKTGIGPTRGRPEMIRLVVFNSSEYPEEGHNMLNFIKNFRADEDGAVTVDWVVLTAAIVGLGIAVLASVRTGATDMADNIQTELQTAVPTVSF